MNGQPIQQHELLKALICDNRYTILVVANNNRIIATNRADPPFNWESTVGRNIYELFIPDTALIVNEALTVTYQTGQQAHFEVIVHTSSQKKYTVTVLPVIREGRVISVILRFDHMPATQRFSRAA